MSNNLFDSHRNLTGQFLVSHVTELMEGNSVPFTNLAAKGIYGFRGETPSPQCGEREQPGIVPVPEKKELALLPQSSAVITRSIDAKWQNLTIPSLISFPIFLFDTTV